MASVSWLCRCSKSNPFICPILKDHRRLASASAAKSESCRKPTAVLYREPGSMISVPRRRQALLQLAFTVVPFPALAGEVSEGLGAEKFRLYSDEENKFKLLIPQDWRAAAADQNGFKSITAFYPEEPSSTSNVSVVITGLGPDYTKMESFGKVEAFADTLVSGLDRSWQRPPGVAAKLIDCKSSKGFYYIEYTLQNPGERQKHLTSALGMASNGWYNRLYTVTGQYFEEEAEKYGAMIEKVHNLLCSAFDYDFAGGGFLQIYLTESAAALMCTLVQNVCHSNSSSACPVLAYKEKQACSINNFSKKAAQNGKMLVAGLQLPLSYTAEAELRDEENVRIQKLLAI